MVTWDYRVVVEFGPDIGWLGYFSFKGSEFAYSSIGKKFRDSGGAGDFRAKNEYASRRGFIGRKEGPFESFSDFSLGARKECNAHASPFVLVVEKVGAKIAIYLMV